MAIGTRPMNPAGANGASGREKSAARSPPGPTRSIVATSTSPQSRPAGDTDTNGAIAGGLLGVRDGVDAIPDRWIDLLQYRDKMRAAAPQLVAMRSRG